MAFSSFTNFLERVSKTKSSMMRRDKEMVTQSQVFHLLIFWEPMLEKIISEGSGASVIMMEPDVPPKISLTQKPNF